MQVRGREYQRQGSRQLDAEEMERVLDLSWWVTKGLMWMGDESLFVMCVCGETGGSLFGRSVVMSQMGFGVPRWETLGE